jgi:hypothetical protein
VTLRDGAMSAAYLDTPTTAIRTFARGVDRLIRAIDTSPEQRTREHQVDGSSADARRP